MTSETRVAVVGGGQAGLSVSYWLQRFDVDHIVFERAEAGDSWKKRWDSFCLVTPNWSLRLPGFPYAGSDPDGFMPRDDIVDYVRRYRRFVDPPLGPLEVRKITPDDGRWLLETDSGAHTAQSVVVAGGSFQTASLPKGAESISSHVAQIHSSEYRNPSQLPTGAVLVVGSAQSGCQIVDDLRSEGREVWLSVSSAVRIPRRYRGRDVFAWLRETGFLELPMSQHPEGPEARYSANPHVSGRDGGKELNLREFGQSGVRLVGRFAGADGAKIRFKSDLEQRIETADEACRQIESNLDGYIEEADIEAPADDRIPVEWGPTGVPTQIDLDEEGITSVVWATGFSRDYSWIEGLETDGHGYPIEQRGVTDLAGLYFVGLHGMHTIGSGLFYGVGTDAEYVVGHLTSRS